MIFTPVSDYLKIGPAAPHHDGKRKLHTHRRLCKLGSAHRARIASMRKQRREKPVIRQVAIADLRDVQLRSSGSNIFSHSLLSKVTRMTEFYTKQSAVCRADFAPFLLRGIVAIGDRLFGSKPSFGQVSCTTRTHRVARARNRIRRHSGTREARTAESRNTDHLWIPGSREDACPGMTAWVERLALLSSAEGHLWRTAGRRSHCNNHPSRFPSSIAADQSTRCRNTVNAPCPRGSIHSRHVPKNTWRAAQESV